MTLLTRSTAQEYLAQVQGGEYEVYEWLCRPEIEERLRDAGFSVSPDRDELTHPLSDVDRVIEHLEQQGLYPTPRVRDEVLQGVKFLKILRTRARKPEHFFGTMTYTIVGEVDGAIQ